MGPFSAANGNAFGAGLNGPGFPDTGFGSQSARMGFAHGPGAAGMQLAHHGGQVHPGLAEHQPLRSQGPNRGRIREVWKHNLQEEMATLRDLVDKYPLIAMVSYGFVQLEKHHPDVSRIPSSQALCQDQWALSAARATTTTNVSEQMSTCSK